MLGLWERRGKYLSGGKSLAFECMRFFDNVPSGNKIKSRDKYAYLTTEFTNSIQTKIL